MGTNNVTRVFELKPNLYQEGSPMLIMAGDIVKNSNTDQIWARLKFQSIVSREISAVKVRLTLYDITATPISHTDYDYLDLCVRRNSVFGAEKLIPLPVNAARSFSVNRMEVFFADKSCKVIEGEWTPVFRWSTLGSSFTAAQVEQYQRDTTAKAQYLVEESADLWLCTCGNVNHQEEDTCAVCHHKKESLLAALNKTELEKHLTAYEEEQQALRAAELAEKGHKKKKLLIAFAIVAALIVAISFVTKAIVDHENALFLLAITDGVQGKTFVCSRDGGNSISEATFPEDFSAEGFSVTWRNGERVVDVKMRDTGLGINYEMIFHLTKTNDVYYEVIGHPKLSGTYRVE